MPAKKKAGSVSCGKPPLVQNLTFSVDTLQSAQLVAFRSAIIRSSGASYVAFAMQIVGSSPLAIANVVRVSPSLPGWQSVS